MTKKKKIGIAILILSLIAYVALGIKYTILYRYGLIFLTIFNGAAFLAYVFKKKTDQTLAPSIMIIMITVYLFGLIGQLKVGVYAILVLYNTLGLGVFAKILISKKFDNFIQTFFPTGTIVFMFIYLILAKTTFNKMFSIWDEFTYWSITPKNMFYLDDFTTNQNSTVLTIGYPPFPATLQYFFLKIIGTYRQGIELFAIFNLGFALLISIFSNYKKNSIIKLVSIIVFIYAVPAIFCEQLFYYTVYGDTLLGLLIGYILFEFFTLKNDKFKVLLLIVASIVLAMTKATGIVILLILAMSLLIYYLVTKKKECKEKNIKYLKGIFKDKVLYVIICMILVGFSFNFSWKLHVNLTVPEDRFEHVEMVTYEGNPIKYIVKVFIKTMFQCETDSNVMQEDIESVGNAPEHFLEKKYYSNNPFAMSAGTWILLFALAFIIIYKLMKDNKEKDKLKIYTICTFIGLALYIAFLQVAYLVMFSGHEAILHSSLQRYLGSYLTAILMFLGFMYIYYSNNGTIKESKKGYAIFTIIVMLFTPITPFFNNVFIAEYYNYSQKDTVKTFIDVSEKIEKNVNKDETIFIINQKANENDNGWRLKYFITPINSSQTKRVDGQNGTLEEEEKKLKEEILKYDYVYYIESDDYFNLNYKDLFENGEIKEWTLYRINKNNGINDIKLIPVNMEE